ncbi:MAG: radical SAM protein, partial [Chloroflexota bacterium]
LGFTGGEALLRRDALDLLRRAHELGLETSVVTNGYPLDDERAARLAEYGVFTYLSMDGAAKKTHQRIRGEGSWEVLLEAVENLRRAGAKFGTVMAAGKWNYHEVSEYVARAQEMEAAESCIIPVMPSGRASSKSILTPLQMMNVVEATGRVADRLKFHVSLWCTPFARLVTRSHYVSASSCRAESGLDISPQGDVLLCDVLDITISDVRDKGLEDAWVESERHTLSRELTRPDLAQPCLDCRLRRTCRGGCYARAKLLLGDLFQPDPLCPRVGGLI